MNTETLAPSVLHKLMKEVRKLSQKKIDDITISFNDEDVTQIYAEIQGPIDTPYSGGIFKVKLIFGADYPNSPPKGFFLTKIFHPNVAKNGEICVNTLKRDWTPDTNISHIFAVCRCLLIEPNPESALNEEAGKLLLENYDLYARRASMMTRIHANQQCPVTDENSSKMTNKKGNTKTEEKSQKKEKINTKRLKSRTTSLRRL